MSHHGARDSSLFWDGLDSRSVATSTRAKMFCVQLSVSLISSASFPVTCCDLHFFIIWHEFDTSCSVLYKAFYKVLHTMQFFCLFFCKKTTKEVQLLLFYNCFFQMLTAFLMLEIAKSAVSLSLRAFDMCKWSKNIKNACPTFLKKKKKICILRVWM